MAKSRDSSRTGSGRQQRSDSSIRAATFVSSRNPGEVGSSGTQRLDHQLHMPVREHGHVLLMSQVGGMSVSMGAAHIVQPLLPACALPPAPRVGVDDDHCAVLDDVILVPGLQDVYSRWPAARISREPHTDVPVVPAGVAPHVADQQPWRPTQLFFRQIEKHAGQDGQRKQSFAARGSPSLHRIMATAGLQVRGQSFAVLVHGCHQSAVEHPQLQ